MNPADVTPQHLANAMQMHVSELLEPTETFDSWFRPPEMKPAGKKHRICDIPYPIPKRRLKKLHRFAQEHLPVHRCAHGGVKTRSCYTAAERHCGRYAIVTRDVMDCYPNISAKAFFDELVILGFRGDTAIVLTALMTVRDRIPQGSPASGDALNIFLFRTDASIEEQATRIRGVYTRSADDMVISVRRREAVSAAIKIIESAIASHGLTVNVKKAAKNGLQMRHEKPLVHNIGVSSRRGTTVSDDRNNRAIACAEGYVRGARSATPSSLVGLAARRERVLGHYHDTRQAASGPATHLKTQVRIGDDLVVRRLRRLGFKCYRDEWWRSSELARVSRADSPCRSVA